MKKIIFTLMTVFVLVLLAGTAKSANETTVLPGGTYTYNLTGVYSFNAATATVTYDGTGGIITELSSSFTITAQTESTVSFSIQYGTQASPATSGTITVEIADGTSNCSNSIQLDITVSALPVYTLNIEAITNGYSECQARTGAGDNTADAVGTESNSFTFEVTPDVQNVTGNFDYSYTISLPTNAELTILVMGQVLLRLIVEV